MTDLEQMAQELVDLKGKCAALEGHLERQSIAGREAETRERQLSAQLEGQAGATKFAQWQAADYRVKACRAESEAASARKSLADINARFHGLRHQGDLTDREESLFYYLWTGRQDHLDQFHSPGEEEA